MDFDCSRNRNHPRHARVDGSCVRRLDPLVGVESRKGETNDDEEGKEAPDATGTEKGKEDSSGIASPTTRFAAVAGFDCNETRSCDSMGVRPADVESGIWLRLALRRVHPRIVFTVRR